MQTAEQPLPENVLMPGEGRLYGEAAGSEYRAIFKLLTEQTDGRLCLEEEWVPPGAGIAPHKHMTRVEFFYVLEGELRFIVGDETIDVGPGTSVIVPKAERHAYSNASDAPAKQLALWTPGGFEALYDDLYAAMPTSDFDWDAFVAIWRRYDTEPA